MDLNKFYKEKYLKYKSKYLSTGGVYDPKIIPYDINNLKVDNIHTLYYEQSGNPEGIPVIWIHGGPGGGLPKEYTKLFDLLKLRIIGYEQRGCGRSTPFGCLENNTTEDLINDLEKLRKHLKIEKWILIGNSWGSTLSLLYGINYPQRVLGMVIGGVCLLRQLDIDWLYKDGGVSNIYPEEWEIFENYIPEDERSDMVKAYYKRLTSEDEETRNKACYNWCQLELKIIRFFSTNTHLKFLRSLKKIIPLAKIECHYFINNSKFMKTDNFIIENSSMLKDIPIIINQSRYDVVCPVDSAYELKRALPHIDLRVNSFGGHTTFEKPTIDNYKKAVEDLINKIKI